MKSLVAFSVLFVTVTSAITAPPETKKASSSPQYGKWGFDTDGADLKTKPGDDFFRYANGRWLSRVQIRQQAGTGRTPTLLVIPSEVEESHIVPTVRDVSVRAGLAYRST